MTPARIQEELEQNPFVPLRLHLASGKTIRISHPGVAWLMNSGLLVFQGGKPGSSRVSRHDIINYRLIERIEQLKKNGNGRSH